MGTMRADLQRLCWVTLAVTGAAFTGAWAAIDVPAIREAIAAKDLHWTAAENPMTRLSPPELAERFGDMTVDGPWVIEERSRVVSRSTQIPSSGADPGEGRDLPPAFDWRSYEGANWVTPPKDQMQCGSCWDFCMVGAWESRMLIERDEPVRSADKSEQFILSCSSGTCTGGSAALAAGFVYATGCPDESCFPYGPPYDATPCADVCGDWAATAETLDTGAYLTTGDVSPTAAEVVAIKTAVLEGPVTTSMRVYEDFTAYGGGIYQYGWGDYLGGHGVVIVGWDDTTLPACWICKNSWSPSWGEGGFFRIAIGEAVSQVGRWTYEIQHYEREHELELCVEDTLDQIGYGSSSPAVRYGGVEYTMPVSGRVIAVMTQFRAMGMSYTAYVYNGISGSGAPGTLLTSTAGTFGSTLGWKRINLPTPVHVSAGSDIFVAVRYATIAYAIPLESFDPADNSGRSWYSSSGTTYTHLTSYGDICVRAVIATASPAPPDTVTGLAATASGSNLNLAWSPVTTDTTGAPTIIANYRVYRSTFALFNEGTGTVVGSPTGTTFTDPGVIGDESVNYYYAVVAVDDFGTPSRLCRRVGEFDRDLP
ncbi:MAG: C1 family peptidase [Candidatus Eisenbacteria bacterium]|nr:C1 family peptidase [Candidatus Eisenbacteria bacterium]